VDGLGAWERDGEAVDQARLALPETGEDDEEAESSGGGGGVHRPFAAPTNSRPVSSGRCWWRGGRLSDG